MGCRWHPMGHAAAEPAIVKSATEIRADHQPKQQRTAVGDNAARPCRPRVDPHALIKAAAVLSPEGARHQVLRFPPGFG